MAGFARGKLVEGGAVHQKNIRPAVVVIIKNGHAGAGGFDDVFFGVDAAEDIAGGETGFGGDIHELRDGLRFRGFGSGELGILRV